MIENRTQPRFGVSLGVRWHRSGTHYDVRVTDISLGGCYVNSILEVIKGETLFFKILRMDGEWFEVAGVVVHHSPRLGFGVRFVNLDEVKRGQMRSLIDQAHQVQEELSETSWHLEQVDITCQSIM